MFSPKSKEKYPFVLYIWLANANHRLLFQTFHLYTHKYMDIHLEKCYGLSSKKMFGKSLCREECWKLSEWVNTISLKVPVVPCLEPSCFMCCNNFLVEHFCQNKIFGLVLEGQDLQLVWSTFSYNHFYLVFGVVF